MTTEGEAAGQPIPIPVIRLDGAGRPVTHAFKGMPCIMLRFSFEPARATAAGYALARVLTAPALLDTGADFNHFAPELLGNARYNEEIVTSEGVTGSVAGRSFEVIFDMGGSFHRTGGLALPVGWNRPWKVVLGRKFLQMTRFKYDGHNGIVDLEYFNNPHAI